MRSRTILLRAFRHYRRPTRRTPVPSEVKDKLLEECLHRCCICGERGHQIHHINGNPSDHKYPNLILLCSTHHTEVEQHGTTSVCYTSGELRGYKKDWIQRVRFGRTQKVTEILALKNTVGNVKGKRVRKH